MDKIQNYNPKRLTDEDLAKVAIPIISKARNGETDPLLVMATAKWMAKAATFIAK